MTEPEKPDPAKEREKERIRNLIAYEGTVELLNATWSLDTGRTVELRLCGDAYDRVHPFKRFQRKRNGRVGTRFASAFYDAQTGQKVLATEVMLAAWKDSSSIGQSITLWLDDEVAVHPFCGCQRRKAGVPGDLFALMLVELNDDDSPVNQQQCSGGDTPEPGAPVPDRVHDEQPARERVPAPGQTSGEDRRGNAPGAVRPVDSPRGHSRPRKLSQSVHLLVTGPLFVRYLQETKGGLVKHWTPELARQYAKKVIGVESLSDLDRDQAAVKRFHEELRRPFARWAHQEP